MIGLHFGLEGNCFLGLFLIFGLVPVARDEVDADAEADADVDPLAVVAVVVVIVPDADVVEASDVKRKKFMYKWIPSLFYILKIRFLKISFS